MSEPFVGEIQMFGGNFAPLGWALCDGQLLAIVQHDALFSVLGTTYGGDGRQTFALPDLRGRVPIHQGAGPGLTNRPMGATGGAEAVRLTADQLPSHSHDLQASTNTANAADASGAVLAEGGADIYVEATPNRPLAPSMSDTGGSQLHPNVMPYQCVNYIIALQGIYPSRN